MEIQPLKLLGVNIHPLTINKLHEHLHRIITSGSRSLVLNINVHCLNLAYQLPWLKEFLNCSDIIFCDGAGVLLGARILGHRIPQRITYADWIWQLSEFADKHEFSLFFLGSSNGIAEKAAIRLKARFPNIKIKGFHHGYFNKSYGSSENEEVVKIINKAKPNILIIGFGMPIQERWLMENWHRIKVNVALTGGAVFDYTSGELCRAPQWMTNYGLEWLGRLIIEPKRLWKRYIIGNPLFLFRLVKERIKWLPSINLHI